MKVEAGLMQDFNYRDEELIMKRLKNLFRINSRKLIEFAVKVLTTGIKIEESKFNEEEKLVLGMLCSELGEGLCFTEMVNCNYLTP